MSYPTFQSRQTQTQEITIGKTPGNGPTIDLGSDALGLVALITARISNVNLDGGTPGPLHIQINAYGSLDGIDWSSNPNPASGIYQNPAWTVCFFTADDPAPLYQQFLISRFFQLGWNWDQPIDIGTNASADISFQIDYF